MYIRPRKSWYKLTSGGRGGGQRGAGLQGCSCAGEEEPGQEGTGRPGDQIEEASSASPTSLEMRVRWG